VRDFKQDPRLLQEVGDLRDLTYFPRQRVETIAHCLLPIASPHHKTYSAAPTYLLLYQPSSSPQTIKYEPSKYANILSGKNNSSLGQMRRLTVSCSLLAVSFSTMVSFINILHRNLDINS